MYYATQGIRRTLERKWSDRDIVIEKFRAIHSLQKVDVLGLLLVKDLLQIDSRFR